MSLLREQMSKWAPLVATSLHGKCPVMNKIRVTVGEICVEAGSHIMKLFSLKANCSSWCSGVYLYQKMPMFYVS